MIPYRYDVEIDFLEDWKRYITCIFESEGYIIEPSLSFDELTVRYFNWINRTVEARPRNIHFSKEFNCPEKHQRALSTISTKIKQGESIVPYLSTRLTDLNYNDDLLNDWGIHHLHLGIDRRRNSPFMKRTKELLYIKFDRDNAYIINVYDHNSFAKKEMVQIIHKNWPEIIKSFKLKGVVSLEKNPTDEEIKMLREGGVNTIIEVEEGGLYTPIGMGITGAGTSTKAKRQADRVLNNLQLIQLDIKNNIHKYMNVVKEQGIELGPKMKFHLVISEDGVTAFESYTRTSIYLGKVL